MQALHRFWPVWGLLTAFGVAAVPVGFVKQVEKKISLLAGPED